MGRDKDAQFDSEFNHPPEARGPWANEVVEERNRAIYCQPCKGKGRTQMAHRVLPGRRGICNWCYRGQPHPEDVKAKGREIRVIALPPAAAVQTAAEGGNGARRTTAVQAGGPGSIPDSRSIENSNKEIKEEVMGRHRLCACGCGEPAGARWKYKRGHKPKGGKKAMLAAVDEAGRIGARVEACSKILARAARRAKGAANGAGEPVSIPVAALDRWFDALPEKVREELLGRLWSELPNEQKAFIFAREVG